MSLLLTLWHEPLVQAIAWSLATILLYFGAKRAHRRWPRWWLMPLGVAPALLMIAALMLHVSYRDYIRGTHWLVALLGPATVAFAVPIYEQRALIRRRWPLLLVGMVAGSLTAVITSWALAYVLGIDGALRLSLLPRSISPETSIANGVEIGGIPDLTAVFVVLTGLFGAAVGDVVLARLPMRERTSSAARKARSPAS
jgi:putative effector of murein hydrolase